jgi:hypothetical protein
MYSDETLEFWRFVHPSAYMMTLSASEKRSPRRRRGGQICAKILLSYELKSHAKKSENTGNHPFSWTGHHTFP